MFACPYCDVKIETESKLIRHNCVEKIRTELIDTPIGFSAFNFYNMWLTYRTLGAKDKDTFIGSKYFNAFVRFAEYQKVQKIPKIDNFIKYCIKNNYEPYIWRDYEIYQNFINTYVANLPAMEALRLSIDTIERICKQYDIPFNQIFEAVPSSVILKNVASYNISPWLLLNSPKFATSYRTKFNKDQRMLMNSIMPLDVWGARIKNDLNMKSKIINIVNELDL